LARFLTVAIFIVILISPTERFIMKKIKVSLGDRSYDITIRSGILASAGGIIKALNTAKSCFVLTNKKVNSLYAGILERSLSCSGFTSVFYKVVDSEKAKSHDSWFRAIKSLAMLDKGRGVCVLALGGGVVGDLAGFVAATYRRGTDFIQIPTTLLAQVDSAIGGKAAIDTVFAKNLIGAFHQPKAVLTDTAVLKSLPARQVRNGLAEIIKYAVILDAKLFLYLEKNISKILNLAPGCMEYIVSRCSRLKAEVVSIDEMEKTGYRSILNFGHTIGHAVEAASCYKNSLNHGEAISVGMMSAVDIAIDMGMANSRLSDRLENLLKQAGLPVKVKGISPYKVISATQYDKKIINNKKRWILPRAIGHVVVCSDIPADIIKRSVEKRVLVK
jgi:3-dehydroquinate synthase